MAPENNLIRLPSRQIYVCTDTVHGPFLDRLAETLRQDGAEVRRGSVDSSIDDLDDISIIVPTIRNKLDRTVLARARRLEGIVFPTIGIESLDYACANEMGLAVGHGATPENFICMAEATLMLALALAYRLDAARAGNVAREVPSATMFGGKTIGFLGLGRIGFELAKRLEPFDVRILASTRSSRPAIPKVAYVGLPELFATSDFIFILATLSEETRGIVSRDAIALMKPGAYLINTARGGLIDEAALIDALRSRHIRGAALDVFENEPLSSESPLRTLDNVILTPHVIGHSQESTDSLFPAAVQNVRDLIARRLPTICKNPEIEPRWRERLLKIQGECPRS